MNISDQGYLPQSYQNRLGKICRAGVSKGKRLWLVRYLRGEMGGQWLLKCGEEV